MSFLNKFKFHYHVKNIDSLISQEKYEEFFDYLEKLHGDRKMFYEISLKYISVAINKYNNDFIKKKLFGSTHFLAMIVIT